MAERERRITPPYGGVFVARKRVMDAEAVRRAVTRIAHEIIERNAGLEDVVRSVRSLAQSTRTLGARAGSVAERELAMAINISAQLRDEVLNAAA